jgi:hypothetical protein
VIAEKNSWVVINVDLIRLFIYSIVVAILLFFTIVVLPDVLNFSKDVSRFIFIILAAFLTLITKDKWYVKLLSAFLGLAVFLVSVVLLSPN